MTSRIGFSPAHLVDVMDQSMHAAAQAGALMQTAEGGERIGRHIDVAGQQLLNFGGCSYLGLERRAELRQGAIDALERYGTQFSFSRAFIQLPLYDELEALLGRITGGVPVVSPTTSLGHISALPAIIDPQDAVFIDQSAHASVHTAAALLRNEIVAIRHNRLDLLQRKLDKLTTRHKRVWYLLDGLYSMVGDFAPIQQLNNLLERYPELHLYIDDAHSTSWTGTHGRGHALELLSQHPRVTVALSLNKGFGTAGGAIIFPTPEMAERVKRAGGPMVFAGPIQPPLLGAAVASARLHLTPEFASLQRSLADRIQQLVIRARDLDVPLADSTHSPIFFVRCGEPDVTFRMVQALRARGICVCAAMFPIVPINQAGIRFTVSMHNQPEDIEVLMRALAQELSRLPRSSMHHRPALVGEPLHEDCAEAV